MRAALDDTVTAALRTSEHALHGRPLIHTDLSNLEVSGVQVEVVLSIGNSGKQDLLDEPGSLALAEGQQVGCLFNRKSADLACIFISP